MPRKLTPKEVSLKEQRQLEKSRRNDELSLRAKDILVRVKEDTFNNSFYSPGMHSLRTPLDKYDKTPLTEVDIAIFLEDVENGTTPSIASRKIHAHWQQTLAHLKSNSILLERFNEAVNMGLDLLEDKIRQRGFDGQELVETTESPEGITIKTKTVVSDALALSYIRTKRPEWRDHTVQDLNAKMSVEKLSDAELDNEIKKLEDRRNGKNSEVSE